MINKFEERINTLRTKFSSYKSKRRELSANKKPRVVYIHAEPKFSTPPPNGKGDLKMISGISRIKKIEDVAVVENIKFFISYLGV